jgi:hypothetical protein
MMTQFRTLFTIAISHTYYSVGCGDFDFLFPADTVKRLQDKKMIARVREGKLYVLFEANETGTPLVSAPGTNLRIGLKLLNPSFTNFTDLGFDFNVTPPLYRNRSDPTALDEAEEIALRGQVFSHMLTGAARPVTVTLKGAAGLVLQTETVTTANNRSAVSYDLSGHDAGVYSVEEAYPGETKAITYYFDPELQRLGVFGILEIKVDGSFYTTAPALGISFQAGKEILKYYIVAKNYTQAEFNQLSVEDEGFMENGQPQVNFDKVGSGAFGASDLSPALLGGSDVRVVLFKSQAAVARRERARKKIQLKKNGEILITHLPQPGGDKADGNMIVRISKP